MKKKLYSHLSIGTLIIGVAAGGYALLKIYIVSAPLPAGTCPVINNRPLLYIGIVMCVLSFVFSLLEQHAKKQSRTQEEVLR